MAMLQPESDLTDIRLEMPHTPPSSNLLDNLDDCDANFPALITPKSCPAEPISPADSRKWSKTLFPDMRPPKKFKLRFIPPIMRDEKTFGVCRKAAVEGELVVLDLTLVGFFLGRRPSFSMVKAALLRQWKLQGNVEIIQMLHGGYAFRFSDLRDRDYILDGDVFFVGVQPMLIQQWDRSLHTGGILGLRQVPLWVSLPRLPLHLWGEEAVSLIYSVLGDPLYTDRNTAMKTRLMFARVCVEFLGDKPLLDSINIEDELGMVYEQKVSYEWKPPHYLTCGVFGHVDCGIKEKKNEMEVNNSEKVLAQEPGLNMEKNKQDLEDSLLVETNGKHHETMREVEEDDGWQPVRARKKVPVGSGAPKPMPFRPGSQRVKAGESLLSASYWKELNPTAGQVRQSDLFPHLVDNLNLNCCPATGSGPPFPSEKVTLGDDISTPLVHRWMRLSPKMYRPLAQPALALQQVTRHSQTGLPPWLGI